MIRIKLPTLHSQKKCTNTKLFPVKTGRQSLSESSLGSVYKGTDQENAGGVYKGAGQGCQDTEQAKGYEEHCIEGNQGHPALALPTASLNQGWFEERVKSLPGVFFAADQVLDPRTKQQQPVQDQGNPCPRWASCVCCHQEKVTTCCSLYIHLWLFLTAEIVKSSQD